MNDEKRIRIKRIENDFSIDDLENPGWRKAAEVSIEKYWSGASAPAGRCAKARVLWSDSAFYVRFEAVQTEPLIVSEMPNLKSKTVGLWDRDVCEIFVAPDAREPQKYYEFEIAPNGEWLDLGIHQTTDKRITDWDYCSGMQTTARIERGKIISAIKIEWTAFDQTPQAGDVWSGNLYRCVGAGETRGYLAWQPTETAQPNFHVPEKFGEFEFVK